jgi:3-dehydroquinate synthase
MCLEALDVRSYKHTYTVRFEDDFAAALNDLLQPGDVVIADATVVRLYNQKLGPVLSAIGHFVIEPSEEHKSYEGIEPCIAYLIENGFCRNNRLIAIGGGITQDITAFTASVLFRGVDWLYFPTTLLAQCDSCIGSKNSINFGRYKNQLGGFYPPREIIVDLNFLDTLSRLDFRSGMGEMMHYYLISGEDDFARILREYDLAFLDKATLCRLIHHSLEFKRKYVEIDEFDRGPRNIFNYGHSFGHAIETLTNYAVPHGIAVTVGMDTANFISLKLGHIDTGIYKQMHELLLKNFSDTDIPNISADALLQVLTKDKKTVGSEPRVILTKGPGKMFVTPLPISDNVKEWLSEYFASCGSHA